MHKLIGKISQWHHFLTETAATMAGPWEKDLPKLALSCDYLAHGIMYTAALHLAYLNPGQRSKYEYKSAQHQDLAIGPFRRAMSTITSENCNQVFAFSGLMIIAQFAPSRSPELLFLSPSTALYKGPANWITCLRGCGYITQQALSHMKSGPLGNLLAQGKQVADLAEGVTSYPDNEDDQSIEYLSQHLFTLQVVKASTTVDEMESYTEAVSWLRKLLAASSTASDSLSGRIFASIWPTQVSDTFVKMLNEERPPALIITAHYCLLLQRCYSCWYMEHRAYDLFRAVQLSLTEEWNPYIERLQRVIQKPERLTTP